MNSDKIRRRVIREVKNQLGEFIVLACHEINDSNADDANGAKILKFIFEAIENKERHGYFSKKSLCN